MQLKQKIEAILYLKGRGLSLQEISSQAGCDLVSAEGGLLDLIHDYAHRDSALEIVETKEGYALQLRPEFGDLVQQILPSNLGKGTLKTLAAIALKSKISQADLVELRGSGVYQQVQELVEQGFIRKRREGRSYWLEVTPKFHQYFETDLSTLK
ncbi:MAG: SMC-Scp complex subunit ScpB [Pseudanabaenaceae cyanobacterium bins.68]|nr:SMC-Scp complex subunit ScpB [Pseudanabaenaceae cyanobacterium bins.68]